MSLVNRFVLNTMLADDQGVCEYVGEECCTVIPMHTGAEGNITKVLEKLKNVKDEHVQNTNVGSKGESWWDWLNAGTWKQTMIRIGMIIGVALLMLMVVMCCVFPLVQLMIKKIMAGQFPVSPKTEAVDDFTETDICEMENKLISDWQIFKNYDQNTNIYEVMDIEETNVYEVMDRTMCGKGI